MCWRKLPCLLAAAMLCATALWYAGIYESMGARIAADPQLQRMKNVTVTEAGAQTGARHAQSAAALSAQSGQAATSAGAASADMQSATSADAASAGMQAVASAGVASVGVTSVSAASADMQAPAFSGMLAAASVDAASAGVQAAADPREDILETTIEGGLTVKNETGYGVDIGALLLAGPDISLPADAPGILIIHTHSSEAYTPSGLDRYDASDTNRTEDTQYNIVRIGDELAQIFESAGLKVIHDRSIYDYPSYTGSYARSGEAVERYLREYPGISIVLDVHRDALGANGIVYKTMAEEEGKCASQAMLLVGSDESGLEHPAWRRNMALALYLQEAVSSAHPTLMRPVSLVRERYNQHLCPGYMILEVGSSGNTLQEALAAARLFGRAASYALLDLVKSPE